MAARTATILFVEDELSLLREFTKVLQRQGHRVLATSQPDEALHFLRDENQIDLVISDMQLPVHDSGEISAFESAGGKSAGLVLAKIARQRFRRSPIIFWTQCHDRQFRQQALALGDVRIISKSSGVEPVLDFVAEALEGFPAGSRPRVLLVHGHDQQALREVKSFLQTDLRFPEPVVLREMPNQGATIIEKLENYTFSIDLVFVLLTPDDCVASASTPDIKHYRARQNVIFEMGFFIGLLGRHSGRVLLLYRDQVELPSDIGGMISIDISKGIRHARQELVQELREWI
jgi:predicted nucleotide-binding protein